MKDSVVIGGGKDLNHLLYWWQMLMATLFQPWPPQQFQRTCSTARTRQRLAASVLFLMNTVNAFVQLQAHRL